MTLRKNMFREKEDKEIYNLAKSYAYEYDDRIREMKVFPDAEELEKMQVFDEVLPQETGSAIDIVKMLHTYGAPATTAQTGGRYFGFVNGGALPVALATKWMTDFWDQCGGLYQTSPINSKLESVCQKWLIDLFNLPEDSVAGFVSGTSMANLSALCAARFRILKNMDWDVNQRGLNGAPEIRIIAHDQVHASVRKTLAILGFGLQNIEWLPSDDQGRAMAHLISDLDHSCLVLLQAGNVNTGAFDPFRSICLKARAANAWVHIDGAFGLWAAASTVCAHLTEGMELANSWAVDGHKTLNTPYDSGIVMCRDADALLNSLQASGAYIAYTENREPIHFGPEMSKRSRGIELWATLKYLGRAGIDELVTGLHQRALQLSHGLRNAGYTILNEVVFNQVLVKCNTNHQTQNALLKIQNSGKCWCGGTKWKDDAAIRISICSWATTEEDIEQTIKVFQESL